MLDTAHPVDNRMIATRARPGVDALLEELHCSDVAAGDLGPEVGQAVAEAEGADVQTAGLPRTAPGIEVHVAHWSLRYSAVHIRQLSHGKVFTITEQAPPRAFSWLLNGPMIQP